MKSIAFVVQFVNQFNNKLSKSLVFALIAITNSSVLLMITMFVTSCNSNKLLWLRSHPWLFWQSAAGTGHSPARPPLYYCHAARRRHTSQLQGGVCTCFSHHKHWTSHQHWTVYSNFKMREGRNIPLFAVLDPIRPSDGWGGVDNWRDMRWEGSWISAPAGTVSTPPRCWPTNEAGVPGRARSCGPPRRRTSDTLILQHNLYFAFILVQTNGRGFLEYS